MSLITAGSANPKVLMSTQPETPVPRSVGHGAGEKLTPMQRENQDDALGTLSYVGERWEGQGGQQAPSERSAPACGTEMLLTGPAPALGAP